MIRLHLFILCCIGLLLVACGEEGEPVTAVSTPLNAATPTHTVELTNTAVLPTQPPVTDTPMGMKTAVLPTNTATVSPTTATSTALSAGVPTQTPTITPTLLPLPPGEIYFFWDTETPLEEPAYYSIPLYEPKQDLYIAAPGDSPDHWQISSILRNQLNWPDETMGGISALSPDQSMIAFTLHKRIDNSTDVASIYVVNLLDSTVEQLTQDHLPRIYNISWLPDSQTVAYSLKQAGFLANRNNIFSEQFTPTLPTDISKLQVSPDGHFAAIILQYSKMLFINMETSELLSTPIDAATSPNNAIWSPDSKWFAFNQVSGSGFSVFNVETKELVSLLDSAYFGLPSWSADGSQLAFVTGTRENTDLYLWDPASKVSSFVMNLGNYLKAPVWSPQGAFLATGSMEDGLAKIFILETSTGKINPLTQVENVYDFDILS